MFALQSQTGNSKISVANSRSETALLSYAQERLWFLDELEGSSALYNVALVLRLRGSIDVMALERSLQAIVERHEVLRTAIEKDEKGNAYQRVSDERLSLVQLSVDESALWSCVTEEKARPFDLSEALKIRASLFHVKSSGVDSTAETLEAILVIALHHIASDGWSMGVLQRELRELYGAYRAGSEPELPALPIQYADYAVWQREWLTGERLSSQLSYWQTQLAGAPALLELPTDYPRPAHQRFEGSVEEFALSAELSDRLRKFSRSRGVTLYMTLLSAFSVLLSRYSGQQDIVVGTPIANRTRVETESLIGFFVNTLVMRTDLSGELSVEQLLSRVKEITLSAYQHQDLPFEKLVEALQPNRSMSYSPLFQVMLVLQNTPQHDLALTALEVEAVSSIEQQGAGSAKFDLTLNIVEAAAGLSCQFSYNTDLFKRSSIARMAKHLECLLEGMLADPNCVVTRLPLLTRAEQQQLLEEWNPRQETTDHRSLVELFEAQVSVSPEAIALRVDGEQWSYDRLNASSDQLARYLLSQGFTAEGVVALCMQRSSELIVSIVAVLKAGGCYMPVDPDYPSERQLFMLQDAEAQCVLAQQQTESVTRAIAEEALIPIVVVDADKARWREEGQSSLVSNRGNDHLAYIMYTSGSTGTPKGVGIEQAGVVRLVKGADYLPIEPGDAWLQLSSVTFDASTLEIWSALLNGAELTVMPPGTPSLSTLGSAIAENGITHVFLTSGLFSLMIDEQLANLKGLKILLAGGDVLSSTHAAKALEALPDTQLTNIYGPTENTTCTTSYRITRVPKVGESIPIGKPIKQTQVYLLDEHRQLVPVGVEGELYTGGLGLARGYVNRPDLTAQMFVENPFGAGRLYRTGDRARWRADGTLEFIGRQDQQIKFNGYRIELDEVAITLKESPLVQDAVVMLTSAHEHRLLVAYVVARESTATSELQRYLKDRLPHYMVPTHYVQMDEIPLTSIGKIDRRALPEAHQVAVDASDFQKWESDTEKALASIWSAILKTNQIGRQDNFFDLGGHSLLVMQLVAKVRVTLYVSIPMRWVFDHSTIAQLAEAIDNKKWLAEDMPWMGGETGEEGEL